METLTLVAVWFGLGSIVHGCYPIARKFASFGLKWKLIFVVSFVFWPLYLLDMMACIVAKRGNIH